MKIKLFALALLLCPRPLLWADEAAETKDAATVIEVSGEASHQEAGGELVAVQLGDIYSEGVRLVTKEGGGVHLVLADGSSLTLGSNTEITLRKIGGGEEGSQTFLDLVVGTVHAIVQKLKSGSAFELKSTEGVAAVKGTQFELNSGGGQSAVTVEEGVVAMSDPGRQNVVEVPAMHRASASGGRVGAAAGLSREEAKSFKQRWQHARELHARRAKVLKRLGPVLRKRRAERRARMGAGAKGREARAAAPASMSGQKLKERREARRRAVKDKVKKKKEKKGADSEI